MSVIYKDREREREWDLNSRSGAQSYTTVRRYKIPEHSLEQDTYEGEMRIAHRGGRGEYDDRRSIIDDRRSFVDDRRTTVDYAVERDVERDVHEYHYHDQPEPPRSHDHREYRIQRSVIERSPSPPTTNVREIRIARDYERDLPQRDDQYSLEKYSRDIEYFREPPQQLPQQQQQPQSIYIRNEAPQPMQMQMQPIIIREEAAQPIIIRERVEPSYELIERSEVQDRQIARPRQEEDYYYERRVKEIDRGGRHAERYVDERDSRRDRHGEKSYYSDDDVVYVHKEKDTWDGSETHTKRDVAAGALAGIAAGQIVRHHRKRKGEAAGGNIGNALGYGALGAASAVALDKFNNRDRSRSVSSDRGRHRRNQSHGRGRSKSRVREMGTLAAIAGVGALAYAVGRKNKEKTTVVEEHRHRSRSRRSKSRRGSSRRGSSRRGRSRSVSVVEDGGRSRSASKHMDPKHRNNRTAQVGLASAAVAGLMQRKRSKSRKRKGKRSPSRIREGVPIAAAGVTGAAVAGLYERHKAKKEAKELSRSRSRSRSKSRSRSVLSRLTGRSRSRRGSTASEPVLVEYGGDPIYTDPATRSRSRGRRRRGSSSSDERRHGSRSRSRSKSRARSVAETAAVAGVAGLAAHEAAKRRDRKKAEKEREKRRDEDSAYSTGSYSPYDSPRPSTAHPSESRFFPETNYFPPPPTAPVDHTAPYPTYNPADFPPPPSTVYEPGHPSGFVNQPPYDDMNPGNPYARPPPQQQHDAYYGQPRRPDDNVSAPVPDTSGNEHLFATARGGSRPLPTHVGDARTNALPDRVDESEVSSSHEKTVQFDLTPKGPSRVASPEKEEREREVSDRDEDDGDRRHRRRRKDDERSDSTRESGRHRKRHHRDESPRSDHSDATIELPSRFDEHGRHRPDDPMADKLEHVLQSLFR